MGIFDIICSDNISQFIGDMGQKPLVFALTQQFDRPQNTAGKDNTFDPVYLFLFKNPFNTCGDHLISVGDHSHTCHQGFGNNFGPFAPGKKKIIFIQGIFCPHRTADHAGAAKGAPGPKRKSTPTPFVLRVLTPEYSL